MVQAHLVSPFLLSGYVFEAKDKTTGETVALKRTTKAGEYISREYEILEMLKGCENCVQIKDIFYTQSENGKTAQNLVFEYCPYNLESMIQEMNQTKRHFEMAKIKSFVA